MKCFNCGAEGLVGEGSLCIECQIKLEKLKTAKGVVHWKCSDCGAGGAMVNETIEQNIREKNDIPEGPVGFMVTKEMCPVCGNFSLDTGNNKDYIVLSRKSNPDKEAS